MGCAESTCRDRLLASASATASATLGRWRTGAEGGGQGRAQGLLSGDAGGNRELGEGISLPLGGVQPEPLPLRQSRGSAKVHAAALALSQREAAQEAASGGVERRKRSISSPQLPGEGKGRPRLTALRHGHLHAGELGRAHLPRLGGVWRAQALVPGQRTRRIGALVPLALSARQESAEHRDVRWKDERRAGGVPERLRITFRSERDDGKKDVTRLRLDLHGDGEVPRALRAFR
mmetsp:Transcript_62776/g.103023  ORF Transcript_62776/g.103023 Transcript_62776/m.103023 type:complete len:234 (+) Transcript_62776:89-790(+)